VLDVGCGGGLMTEGMARRGARVVGIDLGPAALEAARTHAAEAGFAIDYRETAAETLAEAEPGRYDVVTCLELLEHVPDPAQLVGACSRLARPGGHVFFSTINRNAKAYALAVVAAEYVLGLLPRGTHDYARFVRPSELDAWARSHELALAELAGFHYSPLSAQWRIGGSVDVNYLAHYRAPAAEESP
jgi:2-polyprenyl-6-hydroxyphenyl methylase/3-demethylubiquinone-9 3-methyltransferase